MDSCEATKVVMSRIRVLDPENASKIVGHILLQEQGEKEVIRLAFAPESVLMSCMNQFKSLLGISTTDSLAPLSNIALQRNSPRVSNPQIVNQISSPSSKIDSLHSPYSDDLNTKHSLTPRSFHSSNSLTPCVHLSSGECKNCDSCRFFNKENGNSEGFEITSPDIDSSGFSEFFRLKALQQHQRSPFIPSEGFLHVPYTNFQDENQRSDLLSPGHPTRTISGSQQIYLTFPPDSIFKEEDVANYFSTFGPVQDVRIPYQSKRMFGFVTFVSSHTVNIILAKGNPHFIGDARILVKPYKEKAKILDKKSLHQQIHKGDCIEQLEIPFGPRMLNTQQVEEQSDLRNTIEFQGQRMMNMQLFDHASPKRTEFLMSLNSVAPSESINFEAFRDLLHGDANTMIVRSNPDFSYKNEHEHDS